METIADTRDVSCLKPTFQGQMDIDEVTGVTLFGAQQLWDKEVNESM